MKALIKSRSFLTGSVYVEQFKSRCDRFASISSAIIMLSLATWIVAQAFPGEDLEPSASLANPTPTDHSTARVQNSAARPAVAAITLPSPPRPSKHQTQTEHLVKSIEKVLTPATPTPIPPKSLPTVRRLGPTGDVIAPKPVITTLRPVEPSAKIEAPAVKKILIPVEEKEPQLKSKHAPGLRETDAAQPKPKTLLEGRALLRVLEHGAGPTIEIAWPETSGARRQLFNRFTNCFGMRVALMRPDGKLFIAGSRAGDPWEINLDRFSGFVRQPAGQLTSKERDLARRIRAHHPGLSNVSSVRIFPRRVDAMLLAGLKQISGKSYDKDNVIHARYRMVGRQVLVEGVTINGRSAPGQVNLVSKCQGGA
jgi:hypothetical protein